MTIPRNPYPATDTIIEYEYEGKKGIVLIERKNEPYGYAIPGGYHDYGLTGQENAIKESKEETNLDVKIIKLFGEYSDPNRDLRKHIISNVYVGIGSGIMKAGSDAKSVGLYTPEEVRGMIRRELFAFDHANILTDYLEARPHAYI